ncbi:uncharacterized protein K02A2.6-like [Haliotis rufescens]|uniref:uncharacterized protein K02A2.6-like n=1 Tax=Haliotis rufescens TaxID=6454 RepID=UPI00201F1043|nr:uncharacterized protein K02A2.6-like [Haliotis rufescens]
MSQLYTLIGHGWPDDRNLLDPALASYWGYRDELSISNGIICKGSLVMIPKSMYREMLEKIHLNHFGAESNIRMAREVLFWPGMRNSIHDMCSACGTCAQYGNEAPREPMKSLPIPTMSWQIISQDLFAFEKKTYLVTVCHFSDWIELDELEDTLSATVIARTKAHFSRYGIPSVCHTDNGPQFISKEYEDFAQQYHFRHTTSSPYHPQGNGKAESAVKVAKAMMKKSDDKELAFLNYRNSPQKGHTYSPAQRMMNRRTRTLLPTPNQLLQPQVVDPEIVYREIRGKGISSKTQYDGSSGTEHEPIETGSYVYAKPPPNQRGKPWAYGQVIDKDNTRSYTIKKRLAQ